ncbi:MAG: FeoB-associated Cys-rich membrane protein [Prosthecobacter sp.]|nr:FeoB-associated Cys-rich membrane protein [Prosthecobacter sp.]
MGTETNDWQSWAALGVVAVTLAIFLIRNLKSGKKSGCGGACGCSYKPQKMSDPKVTAKR